MHLLITTTAIFGLVVLLQTTCLWLIAAARQDNSLMDRFYGPFFATGTWITMWLTGAWSLGTIMVAGVVSLWALRLSLRITKKNWGRGEDPRYAAWRATWQQRGSIYVILRSYLQVFMLQAVIITAIATPLILTITANPTNLHPLLWVGLLITLFGLGYESVADWQLDRFITRKKSGQTESTIMQTGLWHYSRRPNYFGETVVWWGFYTATLSLPFGVIGLISPLVITYVFVKITGPIIEQSFLEKYPEEYQTYMAARNFMIPGTPKD